jgi:hypothetical protein
MADVSRPRDRSAHPHLPPTAGLDGLESGTAAEAALQAGSPAARRVGWGFISLYTLAYLGTVLVLLAPLLVTLALKINSLVGIHQAPASLALVTGTGALVAMLGNPFFGKMSDRTSSQLGMRRPWMIIGLVCGCLGILTVALAPNIPIVLIGWALAQLSFNALLAAMVAVLPDQVPAAQRGLVSGILGGLYADCVGKRHLLCPTVRRSPAHDVPGPLRDRWVLHLDLRGHAAGSPAC